jgi:CBS domain-containing protein
MEASVPALALLVDAIDRERKQRSALADLRRRHEAERETAGAQTERDTLGELLTCLAAEVFAHEQTLREARRVLAAGGTPSLAPLVRQLHAEREASLGLLGFASRITADFMAPDDASESRRSLFSSFAMWVGAQIALQRAEYELLVPRLLSFDPDLAPTAPSSALPVARRLVVSADGVDTEARVFCPGEGRSVTVGWCATCPAARRVGSDQVLCTPGPRPEKAVAPTKRSGEGAYVGEALSRRHLCVLADVPAGRIAVALSETPAPAVAVIDEGGRLLHLVAAEVVASSPPGDLAHELPGEGARVPETASLADAIAQMVRTHTRFLAVTGRDDRVEGVLGDLDALRWVASHRPDETRRPAR